MSRPGASGPTFAALAVTVALAAAPHAAHGREACPAVPALVDVLPGEVVTLAGRAFDVDIRRAVVGEEDGGRWTRDAVGRVVVDLRARMRDDRSGVVVPGTLVPGVSASVRLERDDGTSAAGDVPLDATGSARGPVLRAELPLLDAAATASVRLDVVDRGVVGLPCPAGEFGLRVRFDAASLPSTTSAVDASTDGPEDDRNLIELASADPRATGVYTGVWGWSDGAVYLAILAHSSGTIFLDVTDPTLPVEVAFIGGPDAPFRDVKTYGTYAYVVTRGTRPGAGLQIVDLGDPSAPALANTYDEAFAFAQNLWIDEAAGVAYAVGTDVGTSILDLADTVNPVEIGRWTDRYVHDAYVADGWAYFAEIGAGQFEILDASDPASGLVVTATVPTPGSATRSVWVEHVGAVAATTDEIAGGEVALHDVTSRVWPVPLLGAFAPDAVSVAADVQYDDDRAGLLTVTRYGLGFRVVDAARPSSPVEWAALDTFASSDDGFAGAVGQYVFDPRGYVYVADSDTGLYVLQPDYAGGTVSGTVSSSAGGAPIAGATVVPSTDGVVRTTAADGGYGVYAEGEVALRVSAWGFAPRSVVTPPVPPGGRVELDVALDPLPAVSLSGTVTAAGTGMPVPGATVRLAGSRLETRSGADGRYAFSDVATGPRIVTAEAFGHASAERRIVLVAGTPATLDLELAPAARADDFEADAGWSAAAGEDPAHTGRWERGDPNGTAAGTVQPEDDVTPDPGVACYVTGNLEGAGVEDDDVASSPTTLRSPAVDASAFDALALRYDRWVSTTAGMFSGGFVEVAVSSDDGATWTVLEAPSGLAGAWVSRTVDVGGVTPISDAMRVRFVASPAGDDGDESDRVLEAAIDDVEWVEACFARFHPDVADEDGDGVVDPCDACPADAADDADGDGVCGDVDNAPLVANADQADGDADGIGDVEDVCPATADPLQRDADRDGRGDACDPDLDGDGVDDAVDEDDDGDGVDDGADVCPRVPDGTQADLDGDGTGDACDPDDGTVQGVRLDGVRIRWEAEDGSDAYHVYRGDLIGPGSLTGAGCRVASRTGTVTFDPDLPEPGHGRFYLVSRVAGGVEGSLGTRSDGTERDVGERCP
jgi:choice-of-anchor B domain-containing protein